MKAEVLDAEVKARVPKAYKVCIEVMADLRHLRVSDILREAIREKIEWEAKSEALARR